MKDTLFVNLEIPIMYKYGRIRFDKNDEKLHETVVHKKKLM